MTAPRNWLNDPNGPIRHGGRFHLFYQYNPVAPVWGAPSWGHVSSADLAHWSDHEPAFAPRPDGPDRDGCWSGCVRLVEGTPVAFYTGVVEVAGRRVESVCTASASDDLLRWEQAPEPLIPGPPPEITTGFHRDPFVFGAPGAWRMLIGSGLGDGRSRSGAILHYSSPDLRTWAYRGVLLQRPSGLGPIDTGPQWECPQLWRAGGDDVLIFSVNREGEPDALRHCVYAVGTLTETSFELRSLGRVDHGNVFYAPAVAQDGDRFLMWGWAQEKHGHLDVGHSGALSLPRVITLRDGAFGSEPAPEAKRLRRRTLAACEISEGASVPIAGRRDAAAGIEVEILAPRTGRTEVRLGTADHTTYDLAIDESAGTATVRSGAFGPFDAPLPRSDEAQRRLRIFADGSLVETFVDTVAMTTRCYEPAATHLEIRSVGRVLPTEVAIFELGDAFRHRQVAGRPEASA